MNHQGTKIIINCQERDKEKNPQIIRKQQIHKDVTATEMDEFSSYIDFPQFDNKKIRQ